MAEQSNKLTCEETRALFWAFTWADANLREWAKDVRDEKDAALLSAERERLKIARRAIRKVNKLRKEGR